MFNVYDFRTTIRGLFSLSLSLYLWYIISLWTCVSWLSWCLPLPLLLQCPWSLFSFAFVSFFTPISIFNIVLLVFVIIIIIIIIIIIVVISMGIIFAMIVVIMFVILILFIMSLMFILICIETLKLYRYTQRSAAQTIVFVYTFFLCAKVWTARCYNSNHQMRYNASRRCGEKGPKRTLYNLWLYSSRGRLNLLNVVFATWRVLGDKTRYLQPFAEHVVMTFPKCDFTTQSCKGRDFKTNDRWRTFLQ